MVVKTANPSEYTKASWSYSGGDRSRARITHEILDRAGAYLQSNGTNLITKGIVEPSGTSNKSCGLSVFLCDDVLVTFGRHTPKRASESHIPPEFQLTLESNTKGALPTLANKMGLPL